MVTWQLVLVVIIASIVDVAVQPMPDPCLRKNHKTLSDVHRSAGFKTGYPETPLCDINIASGWYRFVVDAESKMPETCVASLQCGTTVPIWMKGAHPSVTDGIQTRQACANFQSDVTDTACCGQSINIGVKNCNGFFVYYLHPTPACPMSYCAGKDTPCPASQWSPTGFPPGCREAYPQLTNPPTLHGPVVAKTSFHFACDVSYPRTDPDLAFEFSWLFDGVASITEVVGAPSAVLDGSKLTGLLNKNIGCRVRGFYKSSAERKGPWLDSEKSYWIGINTEPSHITILSSEDRKEVVIRSTLPIVCDSPLIPAEQCCLWIYLAVGGSVQNRNRVVTQQDCKYPLCASQWKGGTQQEVSRTVSVVASKTLIRDGKKNMLVSFSSLIVAESSPYQRIFQGFKIPSVQVDLQQRETKHCSLTGDPHITPLENQKAYDLYRIGDYTAYENTARKFEVQVRTWPCNGGKVTCVCGVAVREKDDLIRINGCGRSFYGQQVGSPEIVVPRALREGTRIMQSRDGSQITLYFPSSSEVKITATAAAGGLMNVYISVPGTDVSNGRGLCGTFDNNPNNELTRRSGQVDSWPGNNLPEAFTESWKNDDSTNLFKTVPASVGEKYEPRYCTCNEDGHQTVNCTYQGDINQHALTCAPNCVDVTGKYGFIGTSWTLPKTKRSAGGNPYIDSDEEHNAYDPDDYADFQPPTFSWPTSSGITESQAETYCSNALRQSQLWSHCQDKTQEIHSIIQNCKADIQIGDTYIRTELVVDEFLTVCKVELAKDPSNYVSTPSGQSILKPEVSEDVCNPLCYTNGRCDRGRCVCNPGFVGGNCQLKDEPPRLERIRRSSLCDFNERPCREVFIDASNIENTETMGCKVQEILENGSVSETASVEEAVFLTSSKLGCSLPKAGIKTEKSVKRFYITATTDGNRYSNAVNLTVFDSSCQNCTEQGCQKLPNTCLINNLCFQDKELNPKDNSLTCSVSHSTTEWSPVPTVASDYPVIASINLSRSNDNLLVRCVISADASNPRARFRVSWGIDGVWIPEAAIRIRRLEAYFRLPSFTASHEVACRVRSFYADRKIFSPYFVSNYVVVHMTE